MRLRHIEVFQAVYSSGSVTRAAEILNVSQPSVSKVLAHAEQQLGYKLFDRIRGKLVPTPEADRLFTHVTRVNESVDRLRQVAENLRSMEVGRIRIAATPAFGVDVLPGAIAAYLRQHADVSFSVETLHHNAICRALLESRIDVGLVFDPVDEPGIASELLATGAFFVLAPPGVDFGERESLAVTDLEGFPYISLDRRGPLGQLLSAHIDSSGARLQAVVHAETYQVAKSLVSNGAGVAITDEITALSSDHTDVQIWPLEPRLQYKMSVLHLETAPISLICRDFIEQLRAVLRARAYSRKPSP